LNLHKGYNFPEAGEYKVTLATNAWQFQGEMAATVEEALNRLTSESFTGSVSVKVHVASLPLNFQNTTGLLGAAQPKSNCNSGYASQITTSGNNAITAAARGYNYLAGQACSTSKTYYIEWFGACDATRYSRVTNNLNAVRNGLQGNYPVDCAGSSCTANTYAYVYPTDGTHTIYVCAVFWKVTTANCVMDSQPGTLIHEMSHFNNVAGTNDVTYGITNCKNLAKSNPGAATTNADNYCFYTDSCPS
jgi:peptidyl-Lys metalloendopeptidase